MHMNTSPIETAIPQNILLVVDDDSQRLAALCLLLEQAGQAYITASDEKTAIEQAATAHPAALLLEARLEGSDSFEICRQIKAGEHTGSIPVIFLVDSPEMEEAAFEAGGDDSLLRPLRKRQFHHYIDQLIHQHHQAAHLAVASEVGKQITTILKPDELTRAVVALLQRRFDYYFVSLWQLNDRQDILSLRAGLGRQNYCPFSVDFTLHKETVRSIIAAVARSGQLHLAQDVSQDPLFMQRDELPDTRSELAVPLRIGARMVGVLDIQSDRSDAFEPQDCTSLQALADQVAVAVRNVELYDMQNRRRAQAELLEQTGRVLTSTLDIREVQVRILMELAGVLPYEEGFVFLREGDQLRVIIRRSGQAAESEDAVLPLRLESDLGQILATGHSLIVDDLSTAPGWLPSEKFSECFSWLGVPLTSRDHNIGILALTRFEPCAFGPSETIFLSTFAAQAAIALENAGLYAEIRRFNEHLEELVKQRTHELDEAYRTLKYLDKAKADFINVAAHELRTPLTVIKGYLSMLQLDTTIRQNEVTLTSVNSVLNGVNRLHEIVNSMLDVARINNQELQVVCEWTRPGLIVSDVQAEFESDLRQRHLTFEALELNTLPMIYADPSLLFKVFYNVVVNAIKYTPDGGKITVSSRLLSEFEGNPAVEILVTDTGIGIDPEHQVLIFDQFYQTGKVALHSSGRTKFKGGGPGLGLAIARGIVQAHHGRIWVESERQDEQTCPGSCFHIILPLSGPEAAIPPNGKP